MAKDIDSDQSTNQVAVSEDRDIRQSLTYTDSGVDIEAGNDFVEAIKPYAKSANRPGVMGGLGGFGGLFDLKAAGYEDPILVAATDGVGTKLKLAIDQQKFDTIGIDLVAMCVNDIIVQGAEPLLFLDYFATSKLDIAQGRDLIAGIAEGCRQANCALLGGETAEMPGLYQPGDFDLAGFSVGACERGQAIDGSGLEDGAILLGLASSGCHSNGYSLVRKVLSQSEDPKADASDKLKAFDLEIEDLLKPTKIYVRSCLAAIKTGSVQALTHITGGGLTENLPRVLPENLAAEVDCARWSLPSLFAWLQKVGNIEDQEMLKVFNCGIGMILAVEPSSVDTLKAILTEEGEQVFEIGHIRKKRQDDEAAVLYKIPDQLFRPSSRA